MHYSARQNDLGKKAMKGSVQRGKLFDLSYNARFPRGFGKPLTWYGQSTACVPVETSQSAYLVKFEPDQVFAYPEQSDQF